MNKVVVGDVLTVRLPVEPLADVRNPQGVKLTAIRNEDGTLFPPGRERQATVTRVTEDAEGHQFADVDVQPQGGTPFTLFGVAVKDADPGEDHKEMAAFVKAESK